MTIINEEDENKEKEIMIVGWNKKDKNFQIIEINKNEMKKKIIIENENMMNTQSIIIKKEQKNIQLYYITGQKIKTIKMTNFLKEMKEEKEEKEENEMIKYKELIDYYMNILLFPRNQIIEIINKLHSEKVLQKCKNLDGQIDEFYNYLVDNNYHYKKKFDSYIQSDKNFINFSININLFNKDDDLKQKNNSLIQDDDFFKNEDEIIEEINEEDEEENKKEKMKNSNYELYLNKYYTRNNQNIYTNNEMELDFESRINIFYKKLKNKKIKSKQPTVILVRRNNLVLDTCKHFSVLSNDDLFKPMYIFFSQGFYIFF
jgi:hypothetical protein